MVLDWWATAPARAAAGPRRFTTVSTWRHTTKDVVWNGARYRWSKHGQFATVMTLPERTAQRMELALACDDADVLARLRSAGLLTFRTLDDAVAALDEVTGNYATHARAAREIAAEYFCAERLLARLLDEAV